MNTFTPNPIAISPTAILAVEVSCSEYALNVRLSDGRELSVPLEWFPRLRDATPKQRANWRLIAGGIGIHWEDVDEDIAVTTLLQTGNGNVERSATAHKQHRKRRKVEAFKAIGSAAKHERRTPRRRRAIV